MCVLQNYAVIAFHYDDTVLKTAKSCPSVAILKSQESFNQVFKNLHKMIQKIGLSIQRGKFELSR